jgi:hypothetical protein
MQIRVLGVPQTGAKSRVETQIKLCIQLVTDGGDKALWWSHLKLPDNMVTKDRQKKSGNATGAVDLEKTLYLQAKVLCASDPTRKVTTCMGCIQREVNIIHSKQDSLLSNRTCLFSESDHKEEKKTRWLQKQMMIIERLLMMSSSH